MTVTAEPRYLTVGEVARELRVSRRSIYRAVEAGTIAAVRLTEHGSLRIPAAALKALLEPDADRYRA